MFESWLDALETECGLSRDCPVVVGVSGGPDSLCLLDLLQRAGYPLVVAHFDHGLRPESAADARQVQALAEARGLPCEVGAADVSGHARSARLSLEAAARKLRYQFLFGVARARDAQAVAVGHTADDQAETVLLHLLRGSGLDGLAGMAPRTLLPEFDERIPLVRPLLTWPRSATEQYCRERGLQPLVDQSNWSRAHLRNRVRHDLLPVLETYNPRIREVLARTARVLRGEAQIVESYGRALFQTCLVEEAPGCLALSARLLSAAPPEAQRRVLREALTRLGRHDVGAEALERGLRCLNGRARQAQLGGGVALRVEGEWLWVMLPGVEPPREFWPQLAGTVSLPVPGVVRLAGGWSLRAAIESMEKAIVHTPDVLQGWHVWLDADATGAQLTVRARRAGDRFQPLGMQTGSLKLSDYFINVKMPRRARDAWPLVCAGDRIAWLPGYVPAEPFRLRPESRGAVHLSLHREGVDS